MTYIALAPKDCVHIESRAVGQASEAENSPQAQAEGPILWLLVPAGHDMSNGTQMTLI